MTMHLEGPWLSTTGKKKSKQKFRNAEAARRARELDESWKELKKRHGVEQEERKRSKAIKAAPLSSSYLSYPPGREPKEHIPSKETGTGTAFKKDSPIYTGNAIKGIATMHKSNAVPVFSQEDAIDIAKMRR
jgi:hypothetical protein